MAKLREELIRETFELSREIGYRHFLAENFDRPDPVLVKLNPEERTAFLRDWWDGARDRMYEGYRKQVAGYSVSDLLDMRADYIDTLDAIGMLQWRQETVASNRDKLAQVFKGTVAQEEESQEQSKELGREM